MQKQDSNMQSNIRSRKTTPTAFTSEKISREKVEIEEAPDESEDIMTILNDHVA